MGHQNDHLTQIICFFSLFLPPHLFFYGRKTKGILEDGIYRAVVSSAILTFHHRAATSCLSNYIKFSRWLRVSPEQTRSDGCLAANISSPPYRTVKDLGVSGPTGGTQYICSVLFVPVESQGPDWKGGEADGSEAVMKRSHG